MTLHESLEKKTMRRVRILVLMTDEFASLGSSIRERIANAEVVEVSTKYTLDVALMNGTYDGVCIQQPLPWLPIMALVRLLHVKLSRCPIIMLNHADTAHTLALLADIPHVETQPST